jgi:nitroreductase
MNGGIMDFVEFNKRNRSYRNYDESYVITRNQLEELITLTRFCPSSVNMQPFKYYLSSDKSTNNLIQHLTNWDRALQPMELPRKGHCPTGFIVICYDSEIGPGIERFWKDTGIVAQTILLGAVNMGLGGCMIGNFSPEKISEALMLSNHLKPVLLIALGKPDEKIVLTDAKEGEDINYYRDENDTHYVPKRTLNELIIKKNIIIK